MNGSLRVNMELKQRRGLLRARMRRVLGLIRLIIKRSLKFEYIEGKYRELLNAFRFIGWKPKGL